MSDTPWTDARVLVVQHRGRMYRVVHADLVRDIERKHPEAFTGPQNAIEAPRRDVVRIGGGA